MSGIVHDAPGGASGHGEDIFSMAACYICRPLLARLIAELLKDELP